MLRRSYAKDLPSFVEIRKAVAYCGNCKRHHTAEGFEKLPLVGVQLGADREPLCVLRNCCGRMTIGADVADVGEPLPDTERKP